MGDQRRFVDGGAGSRLDEGGDDLAEALRRSDTDAAASRRRVRLQDLFDLLCEDLLATGVDALHSRPRSRSGPIGVDVVTSPGMSNARRDIVTNVAAVLASSL